MKNLNTRVANVILRKLLFHTASADYQGLLAYKLAFLINFLLK